MNFMEQASWCKYFVIKYIIKMCGRFYLMTDHIFLPYTKKKQTSKQLRFVHK